MNKKILFLGILTTLYIVGCGSGNRNPLASFPTVPTTPTPPAYINTFLNAYNKAIDPASSWDNNKVLQGFSSEVISPADGSSKWTFYYFSESKKLTTNGGTYWTILSVTINTDGSCATGTNTLWFADTVDFGANIYFENIPDSGEWVKYISDNYGESISNLRVTMQLLPLYENWLLAKEVVTNDSSPERTLTLYPQFNIE